MTLNFRRNLAVATFACACSGACHAQWGLLDQAMICNDTAFTVTAAYVASESGLFVTHWHRGGWWTMEPGQCEDVLPLRNMHDLIRFWVAAIVLIGDKSYPLSAANAESFCVADEKFTDTRLSESDVRNCRSDQRRIPFLKDNYWNGRFDGSVDGSRVFRMAYRIRLSEQLTAELKAGTPRSPPARPPAAPARPAPPAPTMLVCTPEKLTVANGRGGTNYRTVARQDCTTTAGRSVKGCEVSRYSIAALNDSGDALQYADRPSQPTDYVNIVKATGVFERELSSPEVIIRTQGHCRPQ